VILLEHKGRGGKMKFVKENKGLILFFIAIILGALIIDRIVDNSNEKVTSAKNAQVQEWSE